jgi:hypothetical protein
MANVDRPNGFTPVGTMSGDSWASRIKEYRCDSSAGNIYPGDLVIMEADGQVAPATAGNTELLGVCLGHSDFGPTFTGGIPDNSLSNSHPTLNTYHVTGTASSVLVVVGPDVLYEVQEDDDGTALALTDVGSTCDILATAGSTTTGRSQQELDRSEVNQTNGQMKIVDIAKKADNEIGDWCRWYVVINENHFTKIAGI